MKKLVHTSIGTIDIDNTVDGYNCAEDTGVAIGKEIVIKTCKTRVIITWENGEKRIMEPLITTSCMNPENKSVVPLTIRAVYNDNKLWSVVYISDKYETVQLDLDNGNVKTATEEFSPEEKNKDCKECNNCGRC